MPAMMTAIDAGLVQRLLRPRPADGYKGTFGHTLIVAGSEGRAGAAILAAKAALRSGCGLVSVCTGREQAIPLHSHLPEAMVIPRSGQQHFPDPDMFRSVGFGPGAGVNRETAALLHLLLDRYRQPLVLDADGLTVLSQNRSWYRLLGRHVVLTPHPGEFDRLTEPHSSEAERQETQRAFTREFQVTVVLKGHRTVVSLPSGELYRNTTGNNGMGTAGSGDVLTGILASLCAQGYSCAEAALAGTFLHGYAGDLAAAALSPAAMIASDIIDQLPAFFREFGRTG